LGIRPYIRIQGIARAVMAALAPAIKPGATEADIAARAQALMAARGVERFWYYGICALVLVGARSIVSVSGRDYAPTDTRVREGDIVTVDLSPCDAQGHWGDYARSFYVQGGAARTEPVPESGFAEGHALELALHDALLRVARPEMTAHDLWAQMDARIRAGAKESAAARIAYLEETLGRTANADHRRVLAGLLMEQEHIHMLATMPEPFAARVIEPPAVDARKVWPRTLPSVLIFAVLGAGAGFALFAIARGAGRPGRPRTGP